MRGAGGDSPSEARLLSSRDRFPNNFPAAFTLRYRVQRTSRAERPGARPPNTREAFTAAESGLGTETHPYQGSSGSREGPGGWMRTWLVHK